MTSSKILQVSECFLLPQVDIEESNHFIRTDKEEILEIEDGVVEYNRKLQNIHPIIFEKHIIYSKNKSPKDNVENHIPVEVAHYKKAIQYGIAFLLEPKFH